MGWSHVLAQLSVSCCIARMLLCAVHQYVHVHRRLVGGVRGGPEFMSAFLGIILDITYYHVLL